MNDEIWLKIALETSKLVHNECKDVNHDIGIRIANLVREILEKYE